MFIIYLANVMMTFFHHVSLLRFPGCDYSLVRLSFFLSVPMWGAIGVATCISPVPKIVAHWYMCEKHVIHLQIWGVTPSFLLELSGSKNNWRIKTGLCFFHEQIHQHPRASLCQGTFQHPLLEGIGSPLARSFPFFTNWEKKTSKMEIQWDIPAKTVDTCWYTPVSSNVACWKLPVFTLMLPWLKTYIY